MNSTVMDQPSLFESKNAAPRLLARRRAEKTIENLLVLNEQGLTIQQIESFLRACAVLRAR